MKTEREGRTRRRIPGILKALCLINPGRDAHPLSPPTPSLPLSSQIETCCGIPSLWGFKTPYSLLINSFKRAPFKVCPLPYAPNSPFTGHPPPSLL